MPPTNSAPPTSKTLGSGPKPSRQPFPQEGPRPRASRQAAAEAGWPRPHFDGTGPQSVPPRQPHHTKCIHAQGKVRQLGQVRPPADDTNCWWPGRRMPAPTHRSLVDRKEDARTGRANELDTDGPRLGRRMPTLARRSTVDRRRIPASEELVKLRRWES